MSEQSRRRTWQVTEKPDNIRNNCSHCGTDRASYSKDNGENWFCWACYPEKDEWYLQNE